MKVGGEAHGGACSFCCATHLRGHVEAEFKWVDRSFGLPRGTESKSHRKDAEAQVGVDMACIEHHGETKPTLTARVADDLVKTQEFCGADG